MGRKVTRRDIESLVDTLRERIPGLTIRTTFIVGFPGETRAKFNELLRFVEQYRIERVGAFTYSPEEDTPAAELDAQVGGRIRTRRYGRLMALQQQIAFEQAAARVGTQDELIIDTGPRDDGLQLARSRHEAPDIDPVVLLQPGGTSWPAGTFLRAGITEARGYDLVARSRGYGS
jgi:ribosomal protein S12 methylthiotransferase